MNYLRFADRPQEAEATLVPFTEFQHAAGCPHALLVLDFWMLYRGDDLWFQRI